MTRPLILTTFALALAGCSTWKHQPAPAAIPAAPVPAPVQSAHHERETVQFKAAEAINVTVTGTQVENPVKAETAKIVQANKAASADQIDNLVSAFTLTTKAQETEIKRQADQIGDLTAKIEVLKDAELKTQARTLRWFGLGCFAVAGVLAYARQILYAGAVGVIGMLCLGLAQLISQPWFMPAVGIATGLGLIALAVAAWRAYQHGTLAKDVEAERDRLRSTLATLVPAIDGAMSEIGENGRAILQATLSSVMDRDHKAVIHEIRAEAKKP